MSEQYPQQPKLSTITGKGGLEVTVMDWGATIISLKSPTKDGQEKREVLLGVKEPDQWHTQGCYFNATIGRFANRIANNSFELNGKTYKLDSAAQHCLHGGKDGFDKRRFTLKSGTPNQLVYTLHSPDGDMGFPGNYDLTVTYTVGDDNSLTIHYQATCDQPCYTNLTNHAYFNLNGHNSSALGHTLKLNSDSFLPLDPLSIPTGEVRPVKGGAFDFTTPKTVGRDFMQDEQMQDAKGYDHPYLIAGDLKNSFATLTSDDGKLTVDIYTDYPAFQFYSGNYIYSPDAPIAARDDGKPYPNQSGLCFEPEYYPDSPHLPQFAAKNPIIDKDHPLDKTIKYRFNA